MKLQINLCALALLLMIPFTAMAQSKTKAKAKKEVAIQLYSVRDILNKVDNKDGKCDAAYITLLKNLAKMGYTSVEAANYNNGKFYDRTPDQFKKDVESAGLKVLSSHCTRGLSKEELASGDFSSSLQWWDQCIADHKAAGMSYIVAPWMDVPKTLKELDTYCAYYNEIGKRCKQQGMSFGYHNHAHEFQKVEDKVMYDYMIEHTNPEYVFFQMDVYWVVRGRSQRNRAERNGWFRRYFQECKDSWCEASCCRDRKLQHARREKCRGKSGLFAGCSLCEKLIR